MKDHSVMVKKKAALKETVEIGPLEAHHQRRPAPLPVASGDRVGQLRHLPLQDQVSPALVVPDWLVAGPRGDSPLKRRRVRRAPPGKVSLSVARGFPSQGAPGQVVRDFPWERRCLSGGPFRGPGRSICGGVKRHKSRRPSTDSGSSPPSLHATHPAAIQTLAISDGAPDGPFFPPSLGAGQDLTVSPARLNRASGDRPAVIPPPRPTPNLTRKSRAP